MSEERQRILFEKHLPVHAVNYCFSLWQQLDFEFKITRNRVSKYGDYRFDPLTKHHIVTVNHDQNPYAFLITYIHEVAHKVTRDIYKNQVKPHGKEWKMQFKKLMIPMLREDIFPMDILGPLARHMKNPKASSASDSTLVAALRKYDDKIDSESLNQIELGGKFLFRKKVYRKLESRRTRALCEHLESKKQYLISESAPVKRFKN